MQIGIHEAKTNLSRLVSYVAAQGKRPLGLFRGQVTLHGDLLEPLPEDIVADFWPAREEK